MVIDLPKERLLVHARDIWHLVYISGYDFHASDSTVLEDGLDSRGGRRIGHRGIMDVSRRHDVSTGGNSYSGQALPKLGKKTGPPCLRQRPLPDSDNRCTGSTPVNNRSA